MTLWNPLNVFSSGQASSSDEGPSASFDPSRIGDPLGPPSAGPAVGFGDARVGTAASATRAATRSALRRRDGAAVALPDRDLLPPPQRAAARERAPGREGRSHEHRLAEPGDRRARRRRQRESSLRGDARRRASTPFFRREISFRRKKTMDGSAEPRAEHDVDAEADGSSRDTRVDVDGGRRGRVVPRRRPRAAAKIAASRRRSRSVLQA